MMTDGGEAVFVTSEVTGGSDVNRVLPSSINMTGDDESAEKRCDFLLQLNLIN